MNNIDVLNTPIKATPPAKLVTDKKESKYDIFFSTALDSPNEWFLIASASQRVLLLMERLHGKRLVQSMQTFQHLLQTRSSSCLSCTTTTR